jgi:hypothetical protein
MWYMYCKVAQTSANRFIKRALQNTVNLFIITEFGKIVNALYIR